jgi:hypothetical protein
MNEPSLDAQREHHLVWNEQIIPDDLRGMRWQRSVECGCSEPMDLVQKLGLSRGVEHRGPHDEDPVALSSRWT